MGDNHHELEAIWREKWEQAKVNLELARVQFNETEKMPEEDYQRCLQALAIAVNEYSRVLQIYTNLRVHGKIPEREHQH